MPLPLFTYWRNYRRSIWRLYVNFTKGNTDGHKKITDGIAYNSSIDDKIITDGIIYSFSVGDMFIFIDRNTNKMKLVIFFGTLLHSVNPSLKLLPTNLLTDHKSPMIFFLMKYCRSWASRKNSCWQSESRNADRKLRR